MAHRITSGVVGTDSKGVFVFNRREIVLSWQTCISVAGLALVVLTAPQRRGGVNYKDQYQELPA